MLRLALAAASIFTAMLSAQAALADCQGSNGRGWGSGKGAGKFEMSAGDKTCAISFPAFINDAAKTKIDANEVKLTRAPKNGTIGVAKDRGLVYTPKAGFRGEDSYCGSFTSAKVKGQQLRGCVTIIVK